jgi:hypothetical protein
MSLDRMLDRVGDLNPQLLRELKGRLTSSSFTTTLIASGLGQTVISLLLFSDRSKDRFSSDMFQCLNWLMPICLIIGGIYTLIWDLNQEEKRGTLNAIKLSPQSGRSIFLGKILGVPSLVYLAVLSIVPLHLVLAVVNGVNLGLLLAWYCTIGITTYLFLSLTILYILHGGKFAISIGFLALNPVSSLIGIYNRYLNLATIHDRDWMINSPQLFSWFYLPVANNTWLFYGWVCGISLVISHWLWHAIERKYLNPAGTLLSKEYSYWINVSFQLWLIGLALPLIIGTDTNSSALTLTIFYSISIVWVICLMPIIVPTQRMMQEWSYTWHQHLKELQIRSGNQELIQNLIWHDRSPSVVAMAINIAIPAIVWGLCSIVFVRDLESLLKFICGIAIASILTLIYTVVINFFCLRSPLKGAGIAAIVSMMSFFPVAFGTLAAINEVYKDLGAGLLLFSPFLWLGIAQLSLPSIGIAMMAQLGILAGLTKLLQRRLQIVGASTTQRFDCWRRRQAVRHKLQLESIDI